MFYSFGVLKPLAKNALSFHSPSAPAADKVHPNCFLGLCFVSYAAEGPTYHELAMHFDLTSGGSFRVVPSVGTAMVASASAVAPAFQDPNPPARLSSKAQAVRIHGGFTLLGVLYWVSGDLLFGGLVLEVPYYRMLFLQKGGVQVHRCPLGEPCSLQILSVVSCRLRTSPVRHLSLSVSLSLSLSLSLFLSTCFRIFRWP